jgi:hypothetical protein
MQLLSSKDRMHGRKNMWRRDDKKLCVVCGARLQGFHTPIIPTSNDPFEAWAYPQPSKAAARCHSLLATPPKNAISSFGFPQKNKNKQ